MKVEQFVDKDLAHLSYAIVSEDEVMLIDPARDPKSYYAFAAKCKAKIVGVLETHPHADFVSSHNEIRASGAIVYVGELTGAEYPHHALKDGEHIRFGKVQLKALLTPGHSPDSLSYLLYDETGKEIAVFTGDTLFIGDVGRPDLREDAGSIHAAKEILARQLYHSLRNSLMKLSDDVIVYPAHTSGSLCGKSMSKELSSTLGRQKLENYALQEMEEQKFVDMLLDNQPPIPKYFIYDVELNRKGAASLEQSTANIKKLYTQQEINSGNCIIDARPAAAFRSGHLISAINIQANGKFETWLGSIVNPGEPFYLIAADAGTMDDLILRTAKIGYETSIAGSFVQANFYDKKEKSLDLEKFKKHLEDYTIVDIREKSETDSEKIFPQSLVIPLGELNDRKNEIPAGKPVVVHCAGGYRSAIGASILSASLENIVYDLGEDVAQFVQQSH